MFEIWNDTVALGDTICTFPGTLELAKANAPASIYWTNEAAGDLFPHDKHGIERLQSNSADALRITMHDAVHHGPKHHALCGHPTAFFMAHVGFRELSVNPLRPEIVVRDCGMPHYDVVIAPYVLADIRRFWAIEHWQIIADSFNERGLSVAVIGSTKIPGDVGKIKLSQNVSEYPSAIEKQFSRRLSGVAEYIDCPLPEAVDILEKASLAITVDSGPARLKHAIGGDHLLLAHNFVPKEWAEYPGVHCMYGNLAELHPEQVLSKALKILNEN